MSTTYYHAPGSAWRLAPTDDARLVYGAYDGSIACVDVSDGGVLWKTAVGGFPFSVVSDGESTYAATAAGDLVALSGDGDEVFRFSSPRPMYAVARGRFPDARLACGGIHRELVLLRQDGSIADRYGLRYFLHRAVCGDFDGDGRDELFVMDGREEAVLMKVDPSGVRELWRTAIRLPDEYANWENPGNTYKPFSVAAGDVDGDGLDEIILGDSFNNRQTVLLMDGDGAVRWVTEPLKWWAGESTWYEFFSTAFVSLCDYPPEGSGRSIASVAGGLVRIHSSSGALLSSAESRLGFADIAVRNGTLYLGSTPNGDDTIYAVPLQPGWEDEVRGLRRRGLARRVHDNLYSLRRSLLDGSSAGRGTLASGGRERGGPHGGGPAPPFELQQFSIPRDDISHDRYRRYVDSFEQQVPYPMFQHTVGMRVMEGEPVLDENGEPWNLRRFRTDLFHGAMSIDEIVAAARGIEEERIPTVFGVGHNCNPSVQLSTAERMLEAAPTYLVGFQTAEDVSHETIYRYAKYFLGPLCDLCLRYGGKQVVIKNKVLWWLDAPANRGLFEELFAGARRTVIVAATEESNARWSDINVMARMSLLYAGLVGAMKVHIHRDMFCYNRFHQWEYPKSGHPFLRMLVAHTAMGASIYSMGISHVVADGERPTSGLRFNDLGRESTEIFYHLLGRGDVYPPAPADFANIAPVGLVMHEPPAKWLAKAHNNHRPWQEEEDEETLDAVLPRLHCGWGNAPLPRHALSRVLFHKRRVFDGEVPATPYGHILMLPSHFDRSSIPHVSQWFHTDGIYLWREGDAGRLTGAAASDALGTALERGAASLAVRSVGDDVFYQVVRHGTDGYRLFVVDPGWLDPADRRARFQIQARGSYRVYDVLAGTEIPEADGRFSIDVPAGSLRILDAKRTR